MELRSCVTPVVMVADLGVSSPRRVTMPVLPLPVLPVDPLPTLLPEPLLPEPPRVVAPFPRVPLLELRPVVLPVLGVLTVAGRLLSLRLTLLGVLELRLVVVLLLRVTCGVVVLRFTCEEVVLRFTCGVVVLLFT